MLFLPEHLMVFQHTANDDWMEMTRLCLGLLIKCSHHPNSDVVAMATAKLHSLLQSRASQDPKELGYLLFCINKALNSAIDGKSLPKPTFTIPTNIYLICVCYSFILQLDIPNNIRF